MQFPIEANTSTKAKNLQGSQHVINITINTLSCQPGVIQVNVLNILTANNQTSAH